MTIPTACVSDGRTGGNPQYRKGLYTQLMTAKKSISKLTNPANLELGCGNKVIFKSATQATQIFSKPTYFINVTRYKKMLIEISISVLGSYSTTATSC